MGRGGAYVPARVAQQGRIRRSSPAHNACIFGMETPLRGRSGGHAGTAPTVLFGWIVHGTVDGVCVGLRGKILRSVVGAVPVCPPVSPCKGVFVVHSSRTMRVFLVWKRRCANVRAGTQAPPLRFRLDVARANG